METPLTRAVTARKGSTGKRTLHVRNQGDIEIHSFTHICLASQKRNQKRKKRRNEHIPTRLIRMGVKRKWAARRWETASQKTDASVEQARRMAKKESQCCFVSGVPPIAAAPFPAAFLGGLRVVGVAVQWCF